MAMFGSKSVLDMTDEEFRSWKEAIQRRAEYERQSRESTMEAVASAKLRIAFFGLDA